MHGYSWKFIVGIVLLFSNQVVGWVGILIGAYLPRKTNKKFYYILGGAVYALSWVMLALGVVLAGYEGVRLVKRMIPLAPWQSLVLSSSVILLGVAFYAKKRKR